MGSAKMIARGRCFGLVALLVMEAIHYSGDDGRSEGATTFVCDSTSNRTVDASRYGAPVAEESRLLGEA